MADTTQNTTPKQLTTEQRRALLALSTAKTIAEAAAQADVSERTIYRWLADPFFKAELTKAQSTAFEHAARRLTHATNQATDTVLDVMQHADRAGDRLKAALGLLAVLPSLRQLAEFEQRLAALEGKL